MQVFIPFETIEQCVQCLDNKRLFKGFLEGKQILDILVNKKTGAWSNHIVVRIWRGYEPLLFKYLFPYKEIGSRAVRFKSKNLTLRC